MKIEVPERQAPKSFKPRALNRDNNKALESNKNSILADEDRKPNILRIMDDSSALTTPATGTDHEDEGEDQITSVFSEFHSQGTSTVTEEKNTEIQIIGLDKRSETEEPPGDRLAEEKSILDKIKANSEDHSDEEVTEISELASKAAYLQAGDNDNSKDRSNSGKHNQNIGLFGDKAEVSLHEISNSGMKTTKDMKKITVENGVGLDFEQHSQLFEDSDKLSDNNTAKITAEKDPKKIKGDKVLKVSAKNSLKLAKKPSKDTSKDRFKGNVKDRKSMGKSAVEKESTKKTRAVRKSAEQKCVEEIINIDHIPAKAKFAKFPDTAPNLITELISRNKSQNSVKDSLSSKKAKIEDKAKNSTNIKLAKGDFPKFGLPGLLRRAAEAEAIISGKMPGKDANLTMIPELPKTKAPDGMGVDRKKFHKDLTAKRNDAEGDDIYNDREDELTNTEWSDSFKSHCKVSPQPETGDSPVPGNIENHRRQTKSRIGRHQHIPATNETVQCSSPKNPTELPTRKIVQMSPNDASKPKKMQSDSDFQQSNGRPMYNQPAGNYSVNPSYPGQKRKMDEFGFDTSEQGVQRPSPYQPSYSQHGRGNSNDLPQDPSAPLRQMASNHFYGLGMPEWIFPHNQMISPNNPRPIIDFSYPFGYPVDFPSRNQQTAIQRAQIPAFGDLQSRGEAIARRTHELDAKLMEAHLKYELAKAESELAAGKMEVHFQRH
jgi:hypothetical protein